MAETKKEEKILPQTLDCSIQVILSTDGKCTVTASGGLEYADDLYEKAAEIYKKIDDNRAIFKTSTDIYKSKKEADFLESRTDTNAPKCEKCGGEMVMKQGVSKKTGKPYSFWGCSNYPKCDGTKWSN